MKKVVVTYIFGKYDTLKDPTVLTPGWDYLCFSDLGLSTKVWHSVSPNESALASTCPKRRASLLKIQHYNHISSKYDICLTVDGSMQINCNLDDFLDEFWDSSSDLVIARHPDRNCLYEEAEAILSLDYDNPSIVQQQVQFYREQGFPEDFGLYGTRVMIKNNNSPLLKETCELWASEYRSGSRRDQLSLTYAIWATQEQRSQQLKIRSFDFKEVYRQRELFKIFPHLGNKQWR